MYFSSIGGFQKFHLFINCAPETMELQDEMLLGWHSHQSTAYHWSKLQGRALIYHRVLHQNKLFVSFLKIEGIFSYKLNIFSWSSKTLIKIGLPLTRTAKAIEATKYQERISSGWENR